MDTRMQLWTAIPALCEMVDDLPFHTLARRTPCSRYSVQDLLNHLVEEGFRYSALLRGEDPPVEVPFAYGWVPATELRAAMAALRGAVVCALDTEREISTPKGPMSVDVFLRFVEFDLMLHGWMLGAATGRSFVSSADLLAVADDFACVTLSAA